MTAPARDHGPGAKQRTCPLLGADYKGMERHLSVPLYFGFSGSGWRLSARGGRRRLGAFRTRGRHVCAESMQRNNRILVAAVHPPASPAKSAVSTRGVCSLRIPQQGGAVAFDMLNYKPISTRQSPDVLLRGAVEQLPWCQSRWPQNRPSPVVSSSHV